MKQILCMLFVVSFLTAGLYAKVINVKYPEKMKECAQAVKGALTFLNSKRQGTLNVKVFCKGTEAWMEIEGDSNDNGPLAPLYEECEDICK